MSRPESRRSALSGRSPVDPPAVDAAAATGGAEAHHDRRGRGQRKPVTAAPANAGKVQWTNYIDSAIREDARNAVAALAATPGGPASLAELVENGIEREVTRLAQQFNHGKPFPPRSREIRPGRRLGEG